MIKFLKYLFLITLYSVGIFTAEWKFSFFSDMAAADQSYICYVLWGIFGVGTILTFFNVVFGAYPLKKIKKIAEYCTVLGLLGSVVGFSLTFAGLDILSADFSDKNQILKMMDSISRGIPTSLNTTITGIIAAVGLSLYPFFLNGEEK